jgi:hypothetical protein
LRSGESNDSSPADGGFCPSEEVGHAETLGAIPKVHPVQRGTLESMMPNTSRHWRSDTSFPFRYLRSFCSRMSSGV